MKTTKKASNSAGSFLTPVVNQCRLVLLNVLTHVPNASCAHVLADQTPTFHHFHALNVGLELALGPTHRVAHIMPELGGLAANFTFCH